MISGFIPDKIIGKYNKAINPLIDSIYVLLVFIFSYKLGFSIKDIYLIILIYILSPIFFTKWNIGPRSFFTPRIFSEILVNIFLISSLVLFNNSEHEYFLFALVCSFLVIGGSKFGLQVLIFMTPVVCVIDRNYFPPRSWHFSSHDLLFSKFKFHNVIRSQVEHLIWYFKNNLNNNMPVSERNSFSRLFSLKREKKIGFKICFI